MRVIQPLAVLHTIPVTMPLHGMQCIETLTLLSPSWFSKSQETTWSDITCKGISKSCHSTTIQAQKPSLHICGSANSCKPQAFCRAAAAGCGAALRQFMCTMPPHRPSHSHQLCKLCGCMFQSDSPFTRCSIYFLNAMPLMTIGSIRPPCNWSWQELPHWESLPYSFSQLPANAARFNLNHSSALSHMRQPTNKMLPSIHVYCGTQKLWPQMSTCMCRQ